MDQNFRMNFSENVRAHMSVWPGKLTSVMESHRQRFSQLNQKFKQRPIINLHPPSTMYPIILPQASRPQPRQQARSKERIETHFPPTAPTRRANTTHIKNQPSPFVPNQQYITLANLTKFLHDLQAQDKTNDNSDAVTDASTSTTTSAKQRGQQHLQETAIRWWKPIRSPDSRTVPSTTHTSGTSTVLQQHSDENNQLQRNLPLTIISNSSRPTNISSTNTNRNSKYDESEVSTQIQPTNTLRSSVPSAKTQSLKRTRQEPLIMQPRGMHIRSYDHRYDTNHNNNMNFFQQQRLVRQT